MFSRIFYQQSIRALVVGFGQVFNNIHVQRFDAAGDATKIIRVPISYSPKEGYVRALQEPTAKKEGVVQVKTVLPKIGYEVTGLVHDPSRQYNVLNKRYAAVEEEDGSRSYAYVEVPYFVDISMYAYVRNITDGLQIVEQVVPYFAPNFNISLNMTDIARKIDVPINLVNLHPVQQYEGIQENPRFLLWQLDFRCATWLFGPTIDSGIIREVTVNLLNFDALEE